MPCAGALLRLPPPIYPPPLPQDLLSKDQKQRLQLKEKPDTGVYVKDLSSFVVKSVKEIEHVMNVGNKNRSVGVTDMNQHSSRSHAIFIVTIECSERGLDGENHIRVGKLNLVDLAGSERQSKTHAEGQRLKEVCAVEGLPPPLPDSSFSLSRR